MSTFGDYCTGFVHTLKMRGEKTKLKTKEGGETCTSVCVVVGNWASFLPLAAENAAGTQQQSSSRKASHVACDFAK